MVSNNSDREYGGMSFTQKPLLTLDRRKFIRKVISAAPVILTVTSRPVWAECCTASSQLSGNLSNACVCSGEGLSPGYWRNHMSEWHPDYPPYLKFEDVFEVDPFSAANRLIPGRFTLNPGYTLGDVISKAGKHKRKPPVYLSLGFHAVAALQNAATGIKYDLTVNDVIFMVNKAYTSGDKEVMEYLKNELDRLNNQSTY